MMVVFEQVVWRSIYRVNTGGSRQRGAVGGSTIDALWLDKRGVVAPSVAGAAMMADLARVLVTIYTLEMGLRKTMVATSGAWAQGTTSGFSR